MTKNTQPFKFLHRPPNGSTYRFVRPGMAHVVIDEEASDEGALTALERFLGLSAGCGYESGDFILLAGDGAWTFNIERTATSEDADHADMSDLLARLTRIRNRMRAFAEQPSAKTAESYRALFEVVYAELDVIVTDLRADSPNGWADIGPAGGLSKAMKQVIPLVTPEEDAAWAERDKQ